MYIVMIAPECTPVAKVGGLADVVSGLSTELALRGHSVDIILPKYDCMRYDHVWDMRVAMDDLWVPWWDGKVHCTVFFGFVYGRTCYFIEPHGADDYFSRHAYYGFHDDYLRYVFFSLAALEFLLVSNKRPDVIHTHDWQTAIVPVLLYEIYRFQGMENQRVCHTIHNFKHQGVVGDNVLAACRLDRPDYYHHEDRLQDGFNSGALNLTRGAMNYSDFITTVSPRHAWEARFTDQGYGLSHTLYRHQAKFGGILSGLDYEMWNPQIDPLIPVHYDDGDSQPKYTNKRTLRERLMLQEGFKPMLAYVGRLNTQEGVHLIRHALYYALEHGSQFVLLGTSSDEGVNEEFWRLKHQLNDNPDCHMELAFDEDLAHLIYAGADMMVIPSLFEPCGVNQMIALRYGTVPVVRAVGGLADTVFDRDYSHLPEAQRNGYLFHDADYSALESALHRAIGLWYSFPGEFRQLVRNGMACDYSWNHPGRHYVAIYERIRYR